MDGGVPKNLEVGGGYDFFVAGRFWGFFIFHDLPHDYFFNSVKVLKFFIVRLNRNISR